MQTNFNVIKQCQFLTFLSLDQKSQGSCVNVEPFGYFRSPWMISIVTPVTYMYMQAHLHANNIILWVYNYVIICYIYLLMSCIFHMTLCVGMLVTWTKVWSDLLHFLRNLLYLSLSIYLPSVCSTSWVCKFPKSILSLLVPPKDCCMTIVGHGGWVGTRCMVECTPQLRSCSYRRTLLAHDPLPSLAYPSYLFL